MSITSLNFAAFVIVTLIMYYILPRRQQNWLLLVMSYAFYVSWSWFYAAILVVLTLVNFVLMGRIRSEGSDGKHYPNRVVLWAGIGINLAALAVFKYQDFFVPDLLERLSEWSADTGLGTIDLLLPVGMSFYIVGVISTLIDVSRGQAQVPTGLSGLIDFSVYMAYFPKLLAGPIERARSFMPRLAEQRIVDNDVMSRSFTLIVIGVVRKAVIADTLFRTFPADLWNKPSGFSAPQLIGFLFVYGFALYNDFAGYTSVVRGVSGMFGIELSRNFNVPYFSRNLSEFWNRWHITLSNWLRDYIYYPTSRALLRRNPSRTNMPNAIFPALLTMLVSGLWHGPGWNMLLWGAIHGMYLVGERLLAIWRPAGPPDKQSKVRQVFAMGLVFGLVMVAWVPFRTPDVGTAVDYWIGMVNPANLSQRPSARILIILLPALWIDWVQYRRDDELVFLRWPRVVQATLLAIAILVTFLITQSDTGAPFVYQGF